MSPSVIASRIRKTNTVRALSGQILLAACLAGLCSSFWLLAQSSGLAPVSGGARRPPASATSPDPQQLRTEAQALRDEAEKLREESVRLQAALEGERREADVFRWLLTAIVGLGALYGLFQGLYSYFNVQGFNSQADRLILDLRKRSDDARKELDDFQTRVQTKSEADFARFRKECESRFPLFIGLEAALGRMAAQLTNRFGNSSNSADLYRSIDPLDRQEIHHYEKSVAALEFLGASSHVDLLLILRGLSAFYLEKYRADREDQLNPPLRDPNDLLRARFYLHRLRVLGSDWDAWISNSYGAIALRAEDPPDRPLATIHFQRSLSARPHQQCAHYNLAIIAHDNGLELTAQKRIAEAKASFDEAVRELRIAQKEPAWEEKPSPVKASSIPFNLACALTRRAELAETELEADNLLAEALDALKASVEAYPKSRKNFLVDPDLKLLVSNPRYAQDMKELVQKIAQA